MALELVPTMGTQLTHSFDGGQLEDLAKPLNQSFIKERPGPGGKQLKYITGKTAIDTANRIFGVGKWGYRVLSKSREVVGDKEFYTADVELYVLGCPFPFPGEGEGIPLNNTPEQHAKARKEAVTDALKRALRHFGDQFGLALYDEDALVEDNNGNLVQVKNVHPQNGKQQQSQQAKRTVEAVKPQTAFDAKLKAVKARALALGCHTAEEWAALLNYLNIEKISGEAEIATISAYLDKREQKQQAASEKAAVGK